MNPQWPVDSPHIEPPMWKLFPCGFKCFIFKLTWASIYIYIYIYIYIKTMSGSNIHYNQGKFIIWKTDKNTTCNILYSYICQFTNLIKYPFSMCMYNFVSICEVILSTIKFLYQYIWSSTHKLHALWEISGSYFMIYGPGESSGKQSLGEILPRIWSLKC